MSSSDDSSLSVGCGASTKAVASLLGASVGCLMR